MRNYICALCGVRLAPEETIQRYDYVYGDLYVSCPHCRAECRPEEEEFRDGDFEEDE